jgi:two-component system, NtrC family, sensor kinase
MQSAAGRMRNLINNLLTLSRVNTRTHPFAPVDLTRVVEGVLADLEVRIEQSGACVDVGHLPIIEADATQMRQLLQNLISNALKFHQNGQSPVVKIDGQLLKRKERFWAGQSSIDEVCQITVTDNGIGFDEKYLDRIFNISQRLHSRGEFEGSGIGLAICRKIAERHHGSITARSTPGHGSTFIVVLPTKQPQGESPRLESTEDPSPS